MEGKVKKSEKNQKNGFGAWCAEKGPWFYAFVAVTVLLIGAIIALTIVSVNANKDPDVPPFAEGSETGVYYYDVAMGEYVLTLNSGDRFTLSGPELNKSGNYSISGTNMTLDFANDADGTASATIENGKIKLVFNNAELNFIAKIPYTVSFNTNGGSAVDSVTVINGKTVNKPSDPAKDGSVFLGWFSDADFTKAFAFGATPVSSNTTLYAKWADTVEGQDEYVVDFDLGYEGASAIENISTVGGKIAFSANYAAPVRDGYTFVGWYVSAYEDGEKLTYAATEGTQLSANTTLFAVWSDDSAAIQTPAVSVSGNTISWNSVSGAINYVVSIVDPEGGIATHNVTATAFTYDFASLPEGEYKVSVTAKNGSVSSEAAVRYVSNKALDRVSKFTVVGTTLIFNSVEGAEKYSITIDCGNDAHNHTLLDNGKSTSYNFVNCEMQPGGISFVVTATASGRAASVSEPFFYVKNLDKVAGLNYNSENATFNWASVENAEKYYVALYKGETLVAFVDNESATSFCVKEYTGELTLKVYPATTGYNSPEATELAVNKVTPAAPANITANDMIISWDAAEGADSYVIKINGVSYPVTGTSYNIGSSGVNLSVGAKYSIEVQSIGATDRSAFSDPVEFPYVTMGNVKYYSNVLSWDPVIGASIYEVQINNDPSFLVYDACSTEIKFTQSGLNTLRVRPNIYATNADWSVVEVMVYKVTYESRSISGGAIHEYVANGDTMWLGNDRFEYPGFTFAGWYNVPSASAGNGSMQTNKVFKGNSDITLYADWAPNSYTITLEGIDASKMSGAATGDQWSATYTKDFTLPVLTTTDLINSNFAGWYTGPGGTGTRLTDYLGNSVAPYGVTLDSVAYPHFTSGLIFELNSDNTYSVKKGTDVNSVPVLTIPAYYNNLPVVSILENGFYNCDYLVEINIPDTIKLIGTGAFNSCDALKAINVYEVETENPHEVFYKSVEGALLYTDTASGYTYLELYPRAKTGAFTIPEEVDVVRNRAFNYSKVSTLIISDDVLMIGDYAFSNCRQLKEVVFEARATVAQPISVSETAFYGCYSVTKITLPALIKGFDEEEEFSTVTLDYLTALQAIEVEDVVGAYFTAIDGMLCDALGQTIIYCPNAFEGIKGVLTIPVGITSIGNGTFSGRNAFTEIIIPNYVENIGNNAFYGCRNVSKITIKGSRDRALTIGASAFNSCESVREIIFEGNNTALDLGATTVGSYAFANLSELRTVTVQAGANVAEFGSYSFVKSLKLRSIVVEDGAALTKIGNSAFEGAEVLSSFTIPASTTAIGDRAFAGCSFISKVIFAPNGQNIEFGDYVFQNCVSITQVELPATVQSFDGSAFDGCYSLKEIKVDPANPYLTTDGGILYDKDKTEIMFYPKGIDDPDLSELPWNTLTKIGSTVFKDNSNITSVVIPATVTSIGDGAFNGCINLSSVTFETENGTALTVGAYAFANCQKLTSISLPDYTSVIAEGAFYITPLTAFTVPSNVKAIGDKAFMYSRITSINIPATVTYIGDAAFAHSSLASITIEEGTEPLVIGKLVDIPVSYRFESDLLDSSDYNSLIFPHSYIDVYASGVFTGTAVSTINLPARTTDIGAFAFYKATALETVTITDNCDLKTIGDGAFYGSGVKSIALEKTNLESIGEFAFTEAHLVSVKLPKTVTTIGAYAFADNGDITMNGNSYYLTPSLTSFEFELGGTTPLRIGTRAFFNTAFTSITLPKTLTGVTEIVHVGSANYGFDSRIFYRMFEGNTKLEAINVEDGSDLYGSHEGVFFEKHNGVMDTLVFCPPAKSGAYEVPKTVTYIENRAFFMTQLSEITFEEFDKTDANYGKQLLTIGSIDSATSSYWQFGAFASYNSSSSYQFRITRGYPNASHALVKNNAYNNNKLPVTKLTKITFPSHLKLMASYTFYGVQTPGFTIEFNPDSEVEFYQKAIFTNPGLVTLDLPKITSLSTKSWYSSTFGDNKNLKTVNFAPGSTFTLIPHSCFSQCSSLESIVIPESVTYIDEYAFSNCKKLTSVSFEKGVDKAKVEVIEDYAFQSTIISEFVFPNTVTVLGSSIFNGVATLEKVTIGTGLESTVAVDINGNASAAFRGCYSIKEYAVAENHPTLKAVDGVLYDIADTILFAYPVGKSAEVFTVPEGIRTIFNFAFAGYKAKTINLPSTLTNIAEGAFYYSMLESVTIPSTVVEIGKDAFTNSANKGKVLANVTFEPNSQLKTIGARAFSWAIFSEITIPDGVTTIGNSAFAYNTNLTKVVLPFTLRTLGSTVFTGCTKLNSLNLGDTQIDVIASQTFYNTAITELVVPATVTSIAQYGFSNMKKLTTLTFEEGSRLSTLGNYVFQECQSLKSLTFPAGVSDIGYRAFMNCKKLEYIDLSQTQFTELASASATSADYGFFSGCTALKTVTLPETLEVIDLGTFKGLTKLESITIPSSVNTIGDYAFDGCTSLTTVNFATGSSLTALGNDPEAESAIFRGCTSLKSISLPDTIETIGANIFENSGLETLSFPRTLTAISASAFKNCDGLTAVNVPSSVTEINASAFEGCDNIETLVLNEGLEYLGSNAFGDCGSIKSITLPTTLLRIGGNPFANCLAIESFALAQGSENFVIDATGVLYDANYRTVIFYPAYATSETYQMPNTVFELATSAFNGSQLKSIVISDNIKVIPDNCFKNNKNLESVTIPLSVTSIGNNAFQNCEKLNNVAIPSSCVSVGDYAFQNCTSLTDIDFGERNTSFTVGKAFFQGCTSLTEVKLPAGTTALTEYMFENTGIVNLVIPDSVTNLSAKGIFQNCADLETVTFPKNYKGKVGAYMFAECRKLKSAELPDGVSYISEGMFMNCENLEYVKYGEVQSFQSFCFYGCKKITEFYIPEDVWEVGESSFAYCESITEMDFGHIYYMDWWGYTFIGCTNLQTVHMPYGEFDSLYGGDFAGCTNITTFTMGMPYWIEYDSFEGWTSDQTIQFISEDYTLFDLLDWVGGDWLEGTDAVVTDQHGNILNDDCTISTEDGAQLFNCDSLDDLIAMVFEEGITIEDVNTAANWNGDVVTYYDGDVVKIVDANGAEHYTLTWEEIIALEGEDNFLIGATATIYDIDGNLISYDSETGEITEVTDSEGTVIYPAAEE